MDDQLLLRPGRTVDDVLSVLRTLKVDVDNIKNGGGTPNEGQMRYVQWVEHAEVQLRSVFVADAVWRSLFSDRYWHLRSMREDPGRFADSASEVVDVLQGEERHHEVGHAVAHGQAGRVSDHRHPRADDTPPGHDLTSARAMGRGAFI